MAACLTSHLGQQCYFSLLDSKHVYMICIYHLHIYIYTLWHVRAQTLEADFQTLHFCSATHYLHVLGQVS